MIPVASNELYNVQQVTMSRFLRRHRSKVCRDLAISAGIAMLTMALASSLGLASTQSAAYFVSGSLIAHILAVHRILR